MFIRRLAIRPNSKGIALLRGKDMSQHRSYLMSPAGAGSESARLYELQKASDPFTIKRLEAIGVDEGWRCLEVGAGGGSIAQWLGRRVGPAGSVDATDIDAQRLRGLPSTVKVRVHDVSREDLEPAAYDLVHCRFVLQHLVDPVAGFRRIVASAAPGGWVLLEEGDLGLLEFAGTAKSARASVVVHEVFARWRAAGAVDSYWGRQLPGLVAALGLEEFGVEADTPTGRPGEPSYETFRQAWPTTRAAAAAVGLAEDDLTCVDEAFARSTMMVGITTFAAWGKVPE